ncbi:dynactin subunit 1-like, partial [Tropilaelaps mercedesae]
VTRNHCRCLPPVGIFLRQSQVKPLDEMSASRTSIGSTSSSTGARQSMAPPSRSKLRAPTSSVTRKTSLGNTGRPSVGTAQIPSRTESTLSVAASEKSLDELSASMTSMASMSVSTTAVQLEGELTSARVEAVKKDREIDELKAEVKDLQEKLETIIAKRGEDREKIREFEKTKIQLEQLLEYKARITESQADLQKQLSQARKDAQDAIEERNRHAEEMSDVSEAIEMAALDREMAEEKVSPTRSKLTRVFLSVLLFS